MKGSVSRILSLILILFASLCGISSAYNTAIAPPGNQRMIFHKSPLLLQETPASADVLLIQTTSPWGSSANIDVLNALGYSYQVADISDVPAIDLSKYKAVFIANDQDQSFYDHYSQNYDQFEQYAVRGGVLVFFACDRGWAEGNNYTDLPGHVQIGDRYSERNLVAYPHPIVTQELVDHAALFGYPSQALTDADLAGDYCSHNYFLEETLPPAHIVVFRTDDGDKHPTLVVYQLGNGYVVASGNTWEAAFAWWNRSNPSPMSFGRSLPDVFKYAISLAGSQKSIGVKLNVYPEDLWAEKGRPTLWKTQGDLLDIVAGITNDTNSQQSGVYLSLEIDSALVDPAFLYVYRRPSPENIALKPDEEITAFKDNRADRGNRIITIEKLTIPKRSLQAQSQFVFRFKLRNPLQNGTSVDAKLTLGGVNIDTASLRLSEGGPITITSGNKVILTNRELLYRQYANNEGTLDSTGVLDVNGLLESLYRVAANRGAVVYHVDKVDRDDDASRSLNITVEWLEDRKHLKNGDTIGRYHYDSYPETGFEEVWINNVATKIDNMLHKILERSGGVLPGMGRYVAILGGDSIIPFYRIHDPSKTALEYRSHFGATPVTETDALNNYVLSDIVYRDLDGVGWRDGKVEEVYVGRIVGTSAENMRKLLESSDAESSAGKNVAMLEMNMFSCELNYFIIESGIYGYGVIRDIDGTTLDLPYKLPNTCFPDPLNYLKGDDKNPPIIPEDDPARWAHFSKLFTGKAGNADSFDVMRILAHGSFRGVSSSEPYYSPMFTGEDFNSKSTEISQHFSKFRPFFIFDSCMVGLVDGNNASHLFNAMLPLNLRGALGASGPNWASCVIDFNDHFTGWFYDNWGAGKALSWADKWVSPKYLKEQYTIYVMNLFGLPWAAVTPPRDPFKSSVSGRGPLRGSTLGTTSIHSFLQGSLTQNTTIDASHYTIEKSGDYDIVRIEGFGLLLQDEQTPVLPVATIEWVIPLSATLEDVSVTFHDPVSLGNLNIPVYRPPPPVPDPQGLFPLGGYQDCSGSLGIYPVEQYSFSTVEINGAQLVKVKIVPMIFDAALKEATLFGRVDIQLTYSTPDKGLVENFIADRKTCAVFEEIRTMTTIKNTSSENVPFNVRVEIQDMSGSVLGVSEESKSIASNETGTIPSLLVVPGQEGLYRLVMVASDGQNVIGISTWDVRAMVGKINSFTVPTSLVSGGYGTFSFEFENLSGTDNDAVADITIYSGNGRKVAKLPQLTFGVLEGEMKRLSTHWYPANNVETGIYSALLVISSCGTSFSQLSTRFQVINNSVFSNLGNNADRKKKLDTDTFEFKGKRKEEIKLRIESDPAGLSTPGRVKVILRQENYVLKTLTRTVPFEMSSALRNASKCQIQIIQQPKTLSRPSFGGDYRLILESSGNAWQSLQPASDVE